MPMCHGTRNKDNKSAKRSNWMVDLVAHSSHKSLLSPTQLVSVDTQNKDTIDFNYNTLVSIISQLIRQHLLSFSVSNIS